MVETRVEHIHEGSDNSGMGFFLGIVFLIFFILFLIYYFLPVFRNMGIPQIKIPDKVQINIQQQK